MSRDGIKTADQIFSGFVPSHPCNFENERRKLETKHEKQQNKIECLVKQNESLKQELRYIKSTIEERFTKIEKFIGLSTEPVSKTEQIYIKHKEYLEENYFGLFVAFDPSTEKIVEIANNMGELLGKLYKTYPYTKKFYFKRIGSKSLEMIR